MQSKIFSQSSLKSHVLRIEKGEELVSAIKEYCRQHNVKLGSVSGIGAADAFSVGLFNPQSKEYKSVEYKKAVEITTVTGNISTMDGEAYLHLHATFSDENNQVIGGHLNSATISATAEIIIFEIEGEVERVFSEEIGLNLLDLAS